MDIIVAIDFLLIFSALLLVAGLCILFFIRENMNLEREIVQYKELAMSDAHTGLVNRRGFVEQVSHLTALLQRRDESAVRPSSLVFIDLDAFKDINDTLGHRAGDEAIQLVANVLRSAFKRGSDVLARIGGDEFAVYAVEAHPSDVRSIMETVRVRYQDEVSKLFKAQGREMPTRVSLSFGVVEHQAGNSLDACMQEADRRMYENKHKQNPQTVAMLAIALKNA